MLPDACAAIRSRFGYGPLFARAQIMTSQIHSAIDFYDRHPISAQIILAKLAAERGTLEGLRP